MLFSINVFNFTHSFAHSLNDKHFYLIHKKDSIRCYHSRPEWPWEQWQWKSTPNSPKFQDWSLTIRLFSVISRTLVFSTPLQRHSQHILQPQPSGLTSLMSLLCLLYNIHTILNECNIWLVFAKKVIFAKTFFLLWIKIFDLTVSQSSEGGSLCGVMAQVLDCSLKVNKFKLHPHYYIQFQPNTLRKGTTSFIPAAIGLKRTTSFLQQKMVLVLNNQHAIKQRNQNQTEAQNRWIICKLECRKFVYFKNYLHVYWNLNNRQHNLIKDILNFRL